MGILIVTTMTIRVILEMLMNRNYQKKTKKMIKNIFLSKKFFPLFNFQKFFQNITF